MTVVQVCEEHVVLRDPHEIGDSTKLGTDADSEISEERLLLQLELV